MHPSTIVRMSNVTRVYKQSSFEVRALDDLSLEVQSGEFTALTGPSGSGKTTALNLIGALDVPTSGTVCVDDKDLGQLSQHARSELRKRRIGFVFQAYNLIPVLTVFENAELVLRLQGIPSAARKERVMGLLDDVGLSGLHDRRPNEISGGQQQRVAIVRAIASEPAVTLADEPTANLDSATAEQLLDIMQKLNEERGVTFIFSTHDPRVMARAKRTIHLVDGRVQQASP
jgi:putative ABC transport system ATP-binding protein